MTVVVLQSGCGTQTRDLGPTGTVKGTLTFKGKPVEAATIAFNDSTRGFGATTKLTKPGEYELTDPLPVGEYKVVVTPPGPDENSDGFNLQPKPAPDIPKAYRTEETTSLKIKIEKGKNIRPLEMTP